MVCITTLMDNRPSEHKALCVQHGLSLWIETGSNAFLFDCGSGSGALQNAHRLGIDLTKASFTVLSHSHYDHAAGYRDLVEAGLNSPLLYTGPDFFSKKYARNGLKLTDLSAGFDASFLASHKITQRVCEDLLPLCPGCWLVGNFIRSHSFETIAQRFVTGSMENPVADMFRDEVCLALDTAEGIVVIVGCSHPGILNMVDTVRTRLDKPIHAVLGGTHLVEADESRIQTTVQALKKQGVRLLGLNHCSGEQAQQIVSQEQAVSCVYLAAGDCICFPSVQ